MCSHLISAASSSLSCSIQIRRSQSNSHTTSPGTTPPPRTPQHLHHLAWTLRLRTASHSSATPPSPPHVTHTFSSYTKHRGALPCVHALLLPPPSLLLLQLLRIRASLSRARASLPTFLLSAAWKKKAVPPALRIPPPRSASGSSPRLSEPYRNSGGGDGRAGGEEGDG